MANCRTYVRLSLAFAFTLAFDTAPPPYFFLHSVHGRPTRNLINLVLNNTMKKLQKYLTCTIQSYEDAHNVPGNKLQICFLWQFYLIAVVWLLWYFCLAAPNDFGRDWPWRHRGCCITVIVSCDDSFFMQSFGWCDHSLLLQSVW